MKFVSMITLCLAFASLSCKESTTGPSQGVGNLLTNPTFEENGVPSLHGWVVPDSSIIHFSTDIPPDGSGHTITLDAHWYAPWPYGTIYQIVIPVAGTHKYRLSVFGRRVGVGGLILAYFRRPSATGSALRFQLTISDTVWAYYSLTDTITTSATDSLFLTITGGGTEVRAGTSYFNTCRFEELD